MSLRIDHLCLHLPPRCAAWRPLIERRLAREFADWEPRQSLDTARLDTIRLDTARLDIARLDLGRLTLPVEAGPDELARLIAERLRECLASQGVGYQNEAASGSDLEFHAGGRP